MKKRLRKRSKKLLFELKPYLDDLNQQVETPDYINSDPVQFMHAFDSKKDMEIAGFFAALMAWGRRDVVCRKVEELIGIMDYQPSQFITGYTEADFPLFRFFKHRTFKPVDLHGFTLALQAIYLNYTDFENFWASCNEISLKSGRPLMTVFHNRFFSYYPDFKKRTRKHISTPEKNGSCKRLYMYLRWCIRKESPVDPGIWNFINPSDLKIPLDVHVARQSRQLGLLTRRANDWKSVLELTSVLRILDPEDPVKYDYGLFGMGAFDINLPSRFYLNKDV